MAKQKRKPGLRQCGDCKERKPESAFLKLSSGRTKVDFCDECARRNMVAYAKSGAVVADLSKMKERL